MHHLTSDQLIDAVEEAADPPVARHLASCAGCRRQRDELREVLTAVSVGTDIPEPSPLFWDRLSARVCERIAAEPMPATSWWLGLPPWTAVAAVASMAIVVLALVMRSPLAPPSVVSPVPSLAAPATSSIVAGEPPDADGSLDLLADLAAGVDPRIVTEGIETSTGATEQMFTELDPAERIEMRRLLTEALARSGV
jgi:hypothetical protein